MDLLAGVGGEETGGPIRGEAVGGDSVAERYARPFAAQPPEDAGEGVGAVVAGPGRDLEGNHLPAAGKEEGHRREHGAEPLDDERTVLPAEAAIGIRHRPLSSVADCRAHLVDNGISGSVAPCRRTRGDWAGSPGSGLRNRPSSGRARGGRAARGPRHKVSPAALVRPSAEDIGGDKARHRRALRPAHVSADCSSRPKLRNYR